MPAYVWMRQRRLGQSLLWVSGYVVVFILSFSLIASAGGLNQIDGDILESEIERWASSQFGVVVSVSCPSSEPARPGHEFICSGQESGAGPFSVKVRVLNRNGDVEWEVR
jgi:hypothetical protein